MRYQDAGEALEAPGIKHESKVHCGWVPGWHRVKTDRNITWVGHVKFLHLGPGKWLGMQTPLSSLMT